MTSAQVANWLIVLLWYGCFPIGALMVVAIARGQRALVDALVSASLVIFMVAYGLGFLAVVWEGRYWDGVTCLAFMLVTFLLWWYLYGRHKRPRAPRVLGLVVERGRRLVVRAVRPEAAR